ncbi:MAG: hypothetical protein IKO04_07445 [Bacteroidales bacterium]|nr:hypothetical protein [Bacteroidales bacterium]
MKRIILVAVLALVAFSANAQFYVGGQVGFSTGNNRTDFDVLPEVGYVLNETMSVGAVVGFTIAPYFRYNLLELGPATLFVDAQLQLAFWSDKNLVADTKTNDSSIGIGVSPGLAIPFTENLSFVAHLGRVGYYNEAFVVGVYPSNFNAGLYYSF